MFNVDLSVLIKVDDISRYGEVKIGNNNITDFHEKMEFVSREI